MSDDGPRQRQEQQGNPPGCVPPMALENRFGGDCRRAAYAA